MLEPGDRVRIPPATLTSGLYLRQVLTSDVLTVKRAADATSVRYRLLELWCWRLGRNFYMFEGEVEKVDDIKL